MIEAMKHYEAALLKGFPKGASGDVFEHWNKARQAIAEAEKQEPVAWMDATGFIYKIKPKPIWPEVQPLKPLKPLYTTPQPRNPVKFPTMIRRMWSGGEVQDWLDENVNKE